MLCAERSYRQRVPPVAIALPPTALGERPITQPNSRPAPAPSRGISELAPRACHDYQYYATLAGMSTVYLLRNLDPALWRKFKSRCAKDGLPMRSVLLALVAYYVKHGMPE